MKRLLTGYAVFYNRRHGRHGHLFQNRFKSIIVEEDAYFQELVRYIHLNPLRGGGSSSVYHGIVGNGNIVSDKGSHKNNLTFLRGPYTFAMGR